MLAKLKLAAYGLLVILALWFAWGFYVNYSAVTISAANVDPEARIGGTSAQDQNSATLPPGEGATNAMAGTDTNDVTADTNALAAAQPAEPTDNGDTNLAPATTNEAKVVASKTAKKGKKTTKVDRKQAVKVATAETRKSMISYLAGLVLVVVALGVMIAFDVTRHFAHRTVDALFDDDGPAGKDPEYERAEQVWAEGRPLEAVEIMREYLKKNPREQYVALRIAEIYEKDFGNFLAAAMEYEEVLKHKLHPDRWGWTAIHLCNLYSKLGRQAEHTALLERIVREHPQTSAAKKARKHLGLPEDDTEAMPGAPAKPERTQILDTTEPYESSNDSHLPPGFRKKK